MFDGQPIAVGDRVYDLLYGWGTVDEMLADTRFRIKYAGRKAIVTYTAEGVHAKFPQRTLFWANPVIVPPSKGEDNWDDIKAVLDAVVATMRTQNVSN